MHIYKREFVESQRSELILPPGENGQCWRLGFPPEGKITRLIVRQSAGSAEAFIVNLFDREVCDLGSGSSTSLGEMDPMTLNMARIIPQQNVASGETLELMAGNENGGPWSYRNRMGTFTVPDRAIYLKIDSAGNTGGRQFEVAVECEVGGEAN